MKETPISSEFLAADGGFWDFVGEVDKRLQAGAKTYGDASFQGPLKLGEIQEELLDVAGWAAIQWEKIERLKRHMIKVTENELVYNVWDDGDLRSL